jgi:hypothetical protein
VAAAQIVAEQESEIIGSVLLYPQGTVIAIPGSAPITLSWPAVRLLGRVTAAGMVHHQADRPRS